MEGAAMTNRETRIANGERVVEIAQQYIGIKEKGKNMGFNNNALEKEMLEIGWQRGWAYCILWAKLVWLKAYEEDIPCEGIFGNSQGGGHSDRLSCQRREIEYNPGCFGK